MPGIYRPRHPERTVLYRVLFHNFDRFLIAYERRFEKECGYFRPIIEEVVVFKFGRRLLGELCRSAVKTLTVYLEALTGEELVPGIIVAVQTFGDRINFHPHLHLLSAAFSPVRSDDPPAKASARRHLGY